MGLGKARGEGERLAGAAAERLLRAGRLVRAAPGTDDGRAALRTDEGADRYGEASRRFPPGASRVPYTYSPTRVRYPMARGLLVEMYREARARLGDPVAAWAEVTADPVKRRAYQSARGRGGLVRIGWGEALELAAAAHVHTIGAYGPDRVAGFSSAPASSVASYAVGARFMSLIGAPMISSCDGYADLPVASSQVSGDQAGVPEPGEWRDAAYLMRWGSDVPAGARRRGQQVVAVSPGSADEAECADEWLRPHPGTDAALALAMGHVILTEFFVERQVPYFTDYVKRFTDLPFLVGLDRRPDGRYAPGKFVTAAVLGRAADADAEARRWMPVLVDADTDEVVVPKGTLGHRWTRSGPGDWKLDLGGVDPLLSFHDRGGTGVEMVLPRFDTVPGAALPPEVVRGVPAREIGGRLVTTVFDLLLARYAVGRPGLPGDWPGGSTGAAAGYADASAPGTPAWQEEITSVPAAAVIRIARECAGTAERTRGRSMIVTGADTNDWFHSDTMHRAFLSLLMLTGCQGVHGGGWVHRGGQEKVRPHAGLRQLSTAGDWVLSSRQMAGTPYWYLHTGQWRYESYDADALASPAGPGTFAGRHTADLLAQSARLGWTPSYPTFDANPLDLGRRVRADGEEPGDWVAERLADGRLGFACEDPDAPANWPRVLTVWRADPLGTPGRGNEYILRHLLGARDRASAGEAPGGRRPRDVARRDEAPRGKLDLLLCLDFRMTPTALHSDLVLPAATRYEKHDLSGTDTYPYVRAVEPAISPPWQARTDFEIFHGLAREVSELAKGRLDTAHDLVATALQHGSRDETAQPGGVVSDWRDGGAPPRPGRTTQRIALVERDYTAIADRLASFGPLAEEHGMTADGVTVRPYEEAPRPAAPGGTRPAGAPAGGRPSLDTDVTLCEAILARSDTAHGRIAAQGHRGPAERRGPGTGPGEPAATVHERSGGEVPGRACPPSTVSTGHRTPWRTLTGRRHFYLDHDWMAELGEQLPVYRPPLDLRAPGESGTGGQAVTVRYLSSHAQGPLRPAHQEDPPTGALARRGPVIWLSPADASAIGATDNEWVEAVAAGGVVAARAVVSHRVPRGTVFLDQRDRPANGPAPGATGRRGGVRDALPDLLIKPTHLIGGYGQLSFSPDYCGPAGGRRDVITTIRRRSQPVEY
ncbi:molybdopterin-dependent oxidoreductase [Streptomyces sp. DW26H14]|uniref:molybdopterin-dependent oxidoreductase n=1 Tax=Streptomyces sp. DW26H14 TaxID=3435395 RepID=UPI00403DCC6C